MPKFQIDYAFDTPNYGSTIIEADSPEEAQEKAQELHKKDDLIDTFAPAHVNEGYGFRVISIRDPHGNIVVEEFDLSDD